MEHDRLLLCIVRSVALWFKTGFPSYFNPFNELIPSHLCFGKCDGSMKCGRLQGGLADYTVLCCVKCLQCNLKCVLDSCNMDTPQVFLYVLLKMPTFCRQVSTASFLQERPPGDFIQSFLPLACALYVCIPCLAHVHVLLGNWAHNFFLGKRPTGGGKEFVLSNGCT